MLNNSTQLGFSKYSLSKCILVLAGILLVGSTSINFAAASAQAKPDPSVSLQAKQAGGRVPGRRYGGARRGDCPATSTELTALVPETQVVTQTLPETYVGGSTTAAHPTFWFYLPYSLTTDLTAEFILQDDAGRDIYRITSADFSAPKQTPGIISIALPSTVAPLAVGKVYQWYFKLNCGSEAPMYVQGGIERVALKPELANQLANAAPQEQANLYTANDIWYDAVTILAQLHQSNPTDTTIESAWINLLRSTGLEDIAASPISLIRFSSD